MTISTEDLLNSIMDSFDRIDYIKSKDIPSIDLYMDQVTTFMDRQMRSSTRNPKADKILTKTMINNYAKNNLLPPPVKKKYSKEHILVLIFIYYFKGILSIGDIQDLLKPLTDQFFDQKSGFSMEDIYDEVFQMEDAQVKRLKEDVTARFEFSRESFADAPEESRDFLQQFAFICMLSFDVYVKKLLIEKLIDEMREQNLTGAALSSEKAAKEKAARERKAAREKAAREKIAREKAQKENAVKEKTQQKQKFDV